MKALVTGSAGFLGRHFMAELADRGADVVGVDIVDGTDALSLFRNDSTRFDLVVHCAAVAPHRSAIDGRSLAVGAGCLELDAAMFQWAARTKPGRVVYFSSSAAYPVDLQRTYFRLAEDDIDLAHPQQPDAIYGHVKLTGERLADAYRQQGGAVTVLRPFSGYGEDQSTEFPFGAFMERARRREDPFLIWGSGHQVRDWIHVDDVVGGTLAAVEHGVDGPVNLCTGVGWTMVELAGMACKAVGYDPVFEVVPSAPQGVMFRLGDPSRLNEFYTPSVTLEQGVKRALG